jgi:DNA-binding NarL/FixJ family response regulator
VVSTKETRVFAVEDSPVFVSAIEEILSEIAGVSMTGTAADAEAAVQEIRRLSPDVIILDLHLRSGTGIDVLRAIRRSAAKAPVSVVFSSCVDRFCREFCRRQGADFVVDKSENYSQLAEVIRSIVSGLTGNGQLGRLCLAEN